MAQSQSDLAARLGAAPARFLDQFEELRMNLSSEQLIAEAIEINHASIGKEKTLERYRDHLVHFSHYLASAHGTQLVASTFVSSWVTLRSRAGTAP
jgi:hypothetical protein